MSWNYRLVSYADGSGYGLHEVYYDEDGQPWGMTEQPCSFASDWDEGPDAVVGALNRAHVALSQLPLLHEPAQWPGKRPVPTFKVLRTVEQKTKKRDG